MSALVAQRCLNHSDREAAARCPECGGFFCRECITEHDERVICSACLARLSIPAEEKKERSGLIGVALRLFTGVLCAWLFFYLVGWLLLSIPSSFHEGTFWERELLSADGD